MDWGAFQVFAAVCDAGSLSRAAQRLQVNHATVLRRVQALERELGVELFQRGGAYVPTPAGRDLLSGLAGMGARLEASRLGMQGHDAELRGEVRLTTTDTLAHGLLMPLLREFQAGHPQVSLRVAVNNHFLSLTRREADVAIRGSNRPPENLVGRHVGNIRTGPYASKAYLGSFGRRPELAAMDWIAPDAALAHLEQAKWLAANVPAERVVMSVDSLVGMLHAVKEGMGAAMLLCPLADAQPDLVPLRKPPASLDTQVWILTHPTLRQVARVRAFAQFMFERLANDGRLAPRPR
ncbi:MAG: LysR family transcriptional regulator [Burkholderiales bacterium]|nr:LysR family transcriptional regulator [Burkholderiales bacterium]